MGGLGENVVARCGACSVRGSRERGPRHVRVEHEARAGAEGRAGTCARHGHGPRRTTGPRMEECTTNLSHLDGHLRGGVAARAVGGGGKGRRVHGSLGPQGRGGGVGHWRRKRSAFCVHGGTGTRGSPLQLTGRRTRAGPPTPTARPPIFSVADGDAQGAGQLASPLEVSVHRSRGEKWEAHGEVAVHSSCAHTPLDTGPAQLAPCLSEHTELCRDLCNWALPRPKANPWPRRARPTP